MTSSRKTSKPERSARNEFERALFGLFIDMASVGVHLEWRKSLGVYT